MNKFYLSLILIVFIFNSSISQGCYPDGITFSSQSEIDNFPVNNPGCIEIIGSITINGNNINNLDSLNQLTTIYGNLTIGHYTPANPILTSINGLSNLTYLGGGLRIESNQALQNLIGLEGLTQAKRVNILTNYSLTSLTGLDNLENTQVGFQVSQNPLLTDLTGLGSLDSTTQHFSINHNDNLISLDGVNALRYVGIEGINISYNPSLVSITALYKVTSSNGLLIRSNDNLESLYGLDNIDSESMLYLHISDNPFLSTCEVLSVCNYLASPNGDIIIDNNAVGCNDPVEVEEACEQGLPMCMPGGVIFTTQQEMSNFPVNFPTCVNIDGDVTIQGSNITSLWGLHNIISIGGKLTIIDNDSINSLVGLNNLLTVSGGIQINEVNSLSNLSGFDNLSMVIGDFEIFSNDQLASFTGIESLEYIEGNLSIKNNNNIIDLGSLSNLTSISGDLIIQNNNSLVSLDGLDNIDNESFNNMIISNNTLLTECAISSVCDFLSNPTGFLVIIDNAQGCNSIEEVEEGCELVNVSVNQSNLQFIIYPNPATSYFSISSNLYKQISEIRIFNQLAQTVFYKQDRIEYIDISMLSKGVYILEIVTNESIARKKLIIK